MDYDVGVRLDQLIAEMRQARIELAGYRRELQDFLNPPKTESHDPAPSQKKRQRGGVYVEPDAPTRAETEDEEGAG